MNAKTLVAALVTAALLVAMPLASSMMYTVSEQEMAVLLQFGKPIASRTQPGLYFKMPITQEVMRLPKTLQVWHGTDAQDRLVDVPTADGKKVEVTVWAVWRITDPVRFVRTLRTPRNAENRVKEFVRSTARDTITTYNLAEIVRSTNRRMTYTLGLPPEMLAQAAVEKGQPAPDNDAVAIPDFVVPPEAREQITLGRLNIMDRIKQTAQKALSEDGLADGADASAGNGQGRGIELVDIGLSRIEFVPQVREAAFNRAIALMEAIAVKAISEGEQRKQEIINKAESEVQKIEGEGKQEANVLRGKIEAEIIDSYAAAIRETGDFYRFSRNLDIAKESLKGGTKLILTTDSELLRILKELGEVPVRPSDGSVALDREAPANGTGPR